jgi:hypothetical protein
MTGVALVFPWDLDPNEQAAEQTQFISAGKQRNVRPSLQAFDVVTKIK